MFQNGNPDLADELSSPHPSSPPLAVVTPCADPRRRILDATLKTVARRGYDRTTVSRILAEAGVPEALFGEHFEDKQDCFMQAIDESVGAVERKAREQFERPIPWSERVRDSLALLLDALANDEQRARVAFVEMLAAGPAPRERHRRALALFASLLEEGRMETPDSNRLPAQTSEAVVGGIASILHRRVLEGKTATLPSLLGEIAYFALLPYLDQERAIEVAGLTPDA